MTPAYHGFVFRPKAIKSVSTMPQQIRSKAGRAASEGRRTSVRRYWIMQPSMIHVEILKLSRRRARSEPVNGPNPVFTGPRFAPMPNWEMGLLVVGGNIVLRAIIAAGARCMRRIEKQWISWAQ